MCECLVLIKNQVGLDRGKLSLGMFFVLWAVLVVTSESSRVLPFPLTASWQAAVLFRGAIFEPLFCSEYKKTPKAKKTHKSYTFWMEKKVWKTSNLEASFWSMSKYLCFVNLVLTSFFCPLLKKSSNQAWIQGVLACLQSIKDSWGQQGKWESYCSP